MPSALLSRACEYGLRACLYLAANARDGYISIREISEKLDISGAFLTKVLQQLTAAGIMESSRGPAGGVAFKRPLSQVSLKDVVVAIDGPQMFTECVLGLPGCGEQKPCPFHARWAVERERLEKLFGQTSLEDMAGTMENLDFRLRSGTVPA
jgi:Rrf2 family transcriptional regulator, iron-sulfur cluster assembly transcription factor